MQRWRAAAVIGMLYLMASCRADQPIDCIQANRNIFTCVDGNPSVLDEGRFDLCIPHSEPIKVTGVWVSDFEWNMFHEDDGSSRNSKIGDYERYSNVLPALRGSKKLSEIADRSEAIIGRITFVGRRPLCNPLSEPPSIFVDRILSWKVLKTGPSGSITYGPEAK